MTTIARVIGREILDSKTEVRDAPPSPGASTGELEAVELRDGNKARYFGKSTRKAVGNINGEIAAKVRGTNASDQAGLHRLMIQLDGTPNQGKLGANAILAVSMANARAAANAHGLPLYRPA